MAIYEVKDIVHALTAADHDTGTLEIVRLDDRLNRAARREGFRVLGG